jgi:hypothetical protein
MDMDLLSVVDDMAAPHSRIRPSICEIQPNMRVDQQQVRTGQQHVP